MKKKNLLFGILIASGMAVFAQGTAVTQIPQNVQATLQSLYPGVTNVTWEQDGAYYIPTFTINNVKTKLTIDLKGTRVHTSVQIAATDLPAATRAYITSNYPGKTISDAEQLTMFNRATRYEAVVGGVDLLFNTDGSFLKKATGALKQ